MKGCCDGVVCFRVWLGCQSRPCVYIVGVPSNFGVCGAASCLVGLGGSDAGQEGRWTWTNNGDLFWQGDFNGAPVNGRYTNWGIQPDNAGGAENALAMSLAGWPEPFYDLGAIGQWNDLEAGNGLVYVIEFDAVVEPLRAELDLPTDQGVYTGVGIIRGWALSEEEVERIEVDLMMMHKEIELIA